MNLPAGARCSDSRALSLIGRDFRLHSTAEAIAGNADLQKLLYVEGDFNVDLKATPKGTAKLTVAGRASSPGINVYGFMIDPKVWTDDETYKYFEKNPIMLFDHEDTDIAGPVTDWQGESDGLHFTGDVIGLTADDRRRMLIEERVLKGVSVGFRIVDAEMRDIGGTSVPVITKLYLREITLCAFPADTDAQFKPLSERKSLAMKLSAALTSAAKTEDQMDLKKLAIALGWSEAEAEKVTLVDVMARVSTLKLSAEALAKLAVDVGLKADASIDTVREKLTAAALEENRKLRVKNLLLANPKKIDDKNRAAIERLALADYEGAEQLLATMKDLDAEIPDPETRDLSTLSAEQRAARESLHKGKGKITDTDRLAAKKLGMKPEDFDTLANTQPHEALSWIFPGQTFGPTQQDEAAIALREEREAVA